MRVRDDPPKEPLLCLAQFGIALMSLIGSLSVSDALAGRRSYNNKKNNDNSKSVSCSAQEAAKIRSNSIAHIESKVYDFSRFCDYKTNYYKQKIWYSIHRGNYSQAQYWFDRAKYELERKYNETCSYIQSYAAHYGNHLYNCGYTEYANHVRYAGDQGCSQAHGKLGHCLGILYSTLQNDAVA
jgi:hypothetical protein